MVQGVLVEGAWKVLLNGLLSERNVLLEDIVNGQLAHSVSGGREREGAGEGTRTTEEGLAKELA